VAASVWGRKGYRTGFCLNGQCEATSPKSLSGKPLKTCYFWKTCKCRCHADITALYKSVGMERRDPTPEPSILPGMSLLESLHQGNVNEGIVRAATNVRRQSEAIPKDTTETAHMRKRPGQLEELVLDVCKRWLAGEFEADVLSVSVIISQINEGRKPSKGAVGAVLDRWTAMGFAATSHEPVYCFMAISPVGLMLGLDGMRAQVKRDKERKLAMANRGIRPRK
jgi:hypothetical protein